jgi:hypothetical protein
MQTPPIPRYSDLPHSLLQRRDWREGSRTERMVGEAVWRALAGAARGGALDSRAPLAAGLGLGQRVSTARGRRPAPLASRLRACVVPPRAPRPPAARSLTPTAALSDPVAAGVPFPAFSHDHDDDDDEERHCALHAPCCARSLHAPASALVHSPRHSRLTSPRATPRLRDPSCVRSKRCRPPRSSMRAWPSLSVSSRCLALTPLWSAQAL